jgi:hypothetical protein
MKSPAEKSEGLFFLYLASNLIRYYDKPDLLFFNPIFSIIRKRTIGKK